MCIRDRFDTLQVFIIAGSFGVLSLIFVHFLEDDSKGKNLTFLQQYRREVERMTKEQKDKKEQLQFQNIPNENGNQNEDETKWHLGYSPPKDSAIDVVNQLPPEFEKDSLTQSNIEYEKFMSGNNQIKGEIIYIIFYRKNICLLYTSPSPRDRQKSRMPSSA
eukprot:TRINITY_DN7309_c0_g1_i1.p3 TRINITY_DN7309_c0_g1~~TRINITY_DN7309_c0_g1_i1.p3  ORF type:complete len:162 (+),score=22.88 TRINITY_DN7309_c0_g1_i1:63-548(+)